MKRVSQYAHLFPNDVQDVIGTEVVTSGGEVLGQVLAVYLDESTQQKIRFLEVTVPEVRLVQVDFIKDVQKGKVLMNLSAAQVISAPVVASGADLPAWAALYRHYGLLPHWEAGNIFPGY